MEIFKPKRACWSSMKIGHQSVDCTLQKKCTVDSTCDKYYHESFHQAHVDGIMFHATTVTEETKDSWSDSCLLQLMRVSSGTTPSIGLNILWYGGATISLITFKKAREMGLVGDPIKMAVIKVGGEKQELSSYIYDFPIIDKDHKIVHFQVYGINQISTGVSRKNLPNAKHLFKILSPHAIKRSTGEIDVLIGFEYARSHQVFEQSCIHLLVLRNRFGKGIDGSHSLLKENTQKIILHAAVLHVDKVRINNFYESGMQSKMWRLPLW